HHRREHPGQRRLLHGFLGVPAPFPVRMPMQEFIADHVLENADAHARAFADAAPFRHVVIDDFFAAQYAAMLDGEFPPFERGDARTENGDLGNKSTIERIRELGPSFRALDDLIRSREFLDLVGRLTGIDELLYDPWYFG